MRVSSSLDRLLDLSVFVIMYDHLMPSLLHAKDGDLKSQFASVSPWGDWLKSEAMTMETLLHRSNRHGRKTCE